MNQLMSLGTFTPQEMRMVRVAEYINQLQKFGNERKKQGQNPTPDPQAISENMIDAAHFVQKFLEQIANK